MNFTYAYIYDGDNDSLNGNITWKIVNFADSSHWKHVEEPTCKFKSIVFHYSCSEFVYLDEGVYNTYVIDTDYESWSLVEFDCNFAKLKNLRFSLNFQIMHCAEKEKFPRYLSALMMSRNQRLGTNVKAFLREKLPQYNIDLDFMFEVQQDEACEQLEGSMNMQNYYEKVLKKKEEDDVILI